MIKVTYRENGNEIEISEKVKAPIEIDDQLDMSLDSGTISYLATEPDGKGLNEALTKYSIVIDGEQFDFVGMDSRALLRRGTNGESVYAHQVALTEPSKLLQGVLIDGLSVTQPEDYDMRTTLYKVGERLLSVIPFDGQRFWFSGVGEVFDMLKQVKSPQFKWNTQTSLWECLVQMGAVVDAMPRLVADRNGNYAWVTFDLVNTFGSDVEIDDGLTNALGAKVDESQYNTALSAIVENLRENE